ncbi:Proton pump-interactor [Glycine max]|nr:Proton pump-interactor [Glycine max]
MTEEQVVNVRGEESDSGNDHGSVKANGVAHGVGGDSDLAADNNGAASSGKNFNDAVSNGTAEEGTETATVDVVSREDELKSADSQNGMGSVQNGVVDNDDKSANAVAEELVTDHEEYVVVGDSDVQNGDDVTANGVEECEMLDGAEASGDENGVVVEGEEDVCQSDREFECVDVHDDVTATTDENGGNGNDVQGRSESVSDKDVNKRGESENVVSADVSDEKDIVTDGDHDVEEVVEKNEVPVVVDGGSASTDVKECEPEDAQNSLEKGQVESVSGLAEPVLEPSECTEENEIAVEGEPGSKLERSEEEAGSEIVPEGEILTALSCTDVSDIAVESDGEPSVDVCVMKSNAVESDVDVHELKNSAVDSESEPSNGAVQSEIVSEMKNNTEEREAEPSNGAVDCEAELPNGAVESEAEPSTSAVESEAEPSNGVVERETKPSSGAVERETEPSNGAVESVAEPSNGAIDSEAEPSNGTVEREAAPSNGAVEREAAPSNGVVEREAVPSNGAVESEVEPSNGAVDSEAESSNVAVESEAESSNVAVESEAESSNGAVESVAEPSNDAVESGAEPSQGAVESEAEPSNGAVESEADPSNGVAESENEPSVDVCETKNDAVNSEAETSSGGLQSEKEASVVSEMKNNAVESEAEHSKGAVECEAQPFVDVSQKKTDTIEGEAELSVKGGLSVEGEGSNQGDEDSRPASDALDGQNVGAEVVKKPFYYLIRVPRYDDDGNMKEKIRNALHQVEEKSKIRDAIRAESQTIKASCKDFDQEFRAAIAAHRAARDLLKSKRQEMDSVQSTMNRLNNAISVGDIDGKIRSMEHMIEHETLPLNKEKQLIREIKQLKQNREELSSNMKRQDQSQQSLENKDDNIEEHFKLLKKEMEVLRNNVLKSDAETKAAKKKYNDECDKLNELLARFRAADDTRQEAYAKLLALKKQLHEKIKQLQMSCTNIDPISVLILQSKNFWEYRDAATKAQELAAGGKKEELQCFCVDEVERIMELWNKNDEFRRDYVRCNTRSTLRRLQTLDGRSLGPDEEPLVMPNAITERASKNIPMVSNTTMEQEKKSPRESVNVKDEPDSKVVAQRTETSQTTKAKKPTKPAPLEKHVARWGDESDEDEDKDKNEEEPVRTKEEEELILKAEKARKEEEEAKLKEKRRLEEIEKAKEALQRKKRNAEKAQQRAALKAQKEAELKEKEREKRAKKKERRKTSSAVTAENTEQESAHTTETLTSVEESDLTEKPAEVTKKPQKPSQFTRQTKVKSVPAALRNRAKRRIQPWMWVLIAVVVVVALFYVGNSSSLRSSLEGFGY